LKHGEQPDRPRADNRDVGFVNGPHQTNLYRPRPLDAGGTMTVE
jgi:hypothetical protein